MVWLKDNPLIQYIAETIFEDELKKYQEKLKQKEIEAKQKEEELKQKEEELKELKIKALKETVNSLIKVKLRKKWFEFITKIERINDEHKLIKLKEILEEEIPHEELYKIIEDFLNN